MDREPSRTAGAASAPIRRSLLRKGAFALLTVAGFFILLESALWIAGVRPLRRREDPFAGFSSRIPHYVTAVEDGVEVVRLAETRRRHLNPQQFPAKKPEGTFRVVCVGGSTTYGRPFFDRTSLPGLLRTLLPAADPTRRFEVINGGGISYASYRVLGVTRELVRFEPDLVVVYCGHNEFLELKTYREILEAPGAVTEAAAWLTRWRTYTVVRDGLALAGLSPPRSDHVAADVLPAEPEFGPVLKIGPDAYTRTEVDALRARVVRQFEMNLRRIVEVAREAGAEVLLVTPASNLRFAPFKSAHREDLDEGCRPRFDFYFRGGVETAGSGRLEGALVEFEQARVIDERRADLHFATAEVLRQLGRHEEARESYLRAIDEDVVPLRATGSIRRAVGSVASETGALLVDLPEILKASVEDGIPGDETFYDHVHPTISANRLAALAVIEALGLGSGRRTELDRAAEELLSRVDSPSHARELTALAGLLDWLGRRGAALLRVKEAQLLDPENVEALHLEGRLVLAEHRPEEAVTIFRRVLEKKSNCPHARCLLGIALDETGREAEAVEELDRSVQALPTPLACERLGLIHSRRNRHAKAVKAFNEAVRLSPDSALALCNLGLALARMGRETLALERYRKALELDPEFPVAHYNLGLLQEQMGREGEAESSFRRVLKYAPDHSGARDRLREIRAPVPGGK